MSFRSIEVILLGTSLESYSHISGKLERNAEFAPKTFMSNQ